MRIEAYFNCRKICVHETLKGLKNGVPTAYQFRLRSCHASENGVLSPNKRSGNTVGEGDIRLRNQLHLAARQQERHCLDLCLLGTCLLVTSVSLGAKNGHVRRITMHGHSICPEIFWHVSDTRIGTISNPAIVYNTVVSKLRIFEHYIRVEPAF